MRRGGRKYKVMAVLVAAAFLLMAAGGAFATGADYGPLPTPVLALAGTEEYVDAFGTDYIRYSFKVTNYAAYNDGYFEARPDLAACGSNTDASRTWLDIYNASDDSYVYGFCAFGAASDLLSPWFAKLPGVVPPNIYIKLTDRDPAHGSVATSAVLSVYSPAAPVANTDTLTTNEDTQGTVSVLANDTDINGDILFATGIASGPAHGNASVVGNVVHYTPAANYNGADSLTYTLYDGTYSTTGTVNVTITPVPDDPVAVNDSATVNEDSSVMVSVLANDFDVDGNTLTIQSVGNPAHGSASIVGSQVSYAPSANYNGSDSFTYVINDGTGRTDSATVSLTVSSVPDAPNPPTTLLTDSALNPDNVSSYLPKFSWVFSDVDQADAGGDNQTAYEIRIGTAPGTSNAWDSGKKPGTVSNAPYGGGALTPNITYYWSVRVWDKYDLVGSYSADATFVILDIGLRLWDGSSVIKVAADHVGPGYKLRIFKNGVIYGIILVDPADPSASKIRIMTAAGIMALKKM